MPRAALTALRRDAGASVAASGAQRGPRPRPHLAPALAASARSIECMVAIAHASRPDRDGPTGAWCAPPSGANEGSPPDGGFLVPEVWTTELIASMVRGSCHSPQLCDDRPTTAPLADVKVPAIDETSRADGNRWGGAVAYWAGEAHTGGRFHFLASGISSSRPKETDLGLRRIE